jgi:hypothetical protein
MTRRTLTLSLGFFATACATKTGPACAASPPKVLFICQAGTVKSPIARELFRRRAAERGIPVFASARGVAVEDHLSPKLLAAALADGVNLRAEPFVQLTQEDMLAADLVVFFDPPPWRASAHRLLDWTDTPSMNDDYLKAKAVVLAHSEIVLCEFAAAKRSVCANR